MKKFSPNNQALGEQLQVAKAKCVKVSVGSLFVIGNWIRNGGFCGLWCLVMIYLTHVHAYKWKKCVYIYTYIYINIYKDVRTYIHTCMHTYIHTSTCLHYITLHYITLLTLHYTTSHCIALHCIALHCIALHYITLHYVTYIHTYIHTFHTYISYIHTSIPLSWPFPATNLKTMIN